MIKKTFHLWDRWDKIEVVFEVHENNSVEKVWPFFAVTDLTEIDLLEWLEENRIEGYDSICR